ncbi:hypothetical protein DL98DRAFT_632908 [Cadophora sp. DSE1049]|nr:hypothetical protein DL98DRAFT_632908 [Cadophora sp. DSE1049]
MEADATLDVPPASEPGAIPLQTLRLPSLQPSQQTDMVTGTHGENFEVPLQQPSVILAVAIEVENPEATVELDKDADVVSRLVPLSEDDAHRLNLPPLDFKPFMLRPWFLYSSLAFNLLILGLMITLLFKPRFRVLSQWGYFFVQIFPAVIGTITASFLRGITLTLSRLTPFILCASPSGATAGRTILREYFPDPSLTDVVQTKNFTLGYAWTLFILGNAILGFKASLLNTNVADGYREAIVASWALYPLICIYSFVALFMLVVILRMKAAGSTGLRWDPVSLADHLVLFRHSNFLKLFEGTDMATRESMFEGLKNIPLKLGYWERIEGNTISYWHGFGILENGISVLERRTQPSPVRRLSHESAQKLRYRSTYTNMERVPMYIWTVTAFVLCGLFIAGLSTNMMKGYDIPFSANWAAFLFQFVLTFIVTLFTWFWEDLDLFTRSTQPFMYQDSPQPASENLLLDYNCALPYIVTYTALTNNHWKVARISALAPLQRLLPILLFAYIILIPYEILEGGYKRHLPRNYCSIADILSWTYASKLLNQGDMFDIDVLDEENPGKRERWHFQAKLQLACKKYLFGLYKSTTKKDVFCMGIDEDSVDSKSVSSPDVRELSLLSGMRKRNRKVDGGENGVIEQESSDVSIDPRFTFLLDVEAESNTADVNAVPELRQEGQEVEA